MGMALTRFQGIEDAHYLLFLKMLGAPKEEICSVLYFSPPTFESRRVMVDRVAQYALETKEQKAEWSKLNKSLGDAASDRGRIAHYSLDFEIRFRGPDLSADLEIGQPRLRPSRHNKLKEGASPKNQLILREVMDHSVAFRKLVDRL